jgi:hypothetical protein
VTLATVDQVLAAIETGQGETPEALRARAEEIMDDFRSAVASLPGLGHAATELRAKATAIEARDAAHAPVSDALAAVQAAAEAYEATAGPEETAAGRCVAARHELNAPATTWSRRARRARSLRS